MDCSQSNTKVLNDQNQKVQIKIKVNSEKYIFAGVAQGFIDGPLLFFSIYKFSFLINTVYLPGLPGLVK